MEDINRVRICKLVESGGYLSAIWGGAEQAEIFSIILI